MSGVKRKSSFAPADERPSKLAKHSTSGKLTRAPSKPTSLPKFPSVGTSKKTREVAPSGSSPSDGSSDLDSPTPPALRRASTLTVEEKEAAKAAESLTRRTSSKMSLTKKTSSVVIESGTVTTVEPLKSGSSIGETSLVSKESLKKAESIKKALSKTASVRSTGSAKGVDPLMKSLSKTASVRSTGSAKDTEKDAAADEETEETMDTSVPLPPGGLLEVAISFDTTGSMYGVLEEVRAKVKDLAQRLQADIPGIRIAVIAHGDYCDADKYIVKWIDFGASLPELCDFVENVERTSGGDGPECYELVLKRAREELSWTPGTQRVLVVIGDSEPHPVGYVYGGVTYYVDWKEECDLLKQMGVKVYCVKANSYGTVFGFFKEAADLTFGRSLGLKDFTSIFDFLMMICYREGNPDMLPVYESEVRARHKGGMAKDMEDLVKTFGETSASKTASAHAVFGTPYTPFGARKVAKVKTPKLTKAKPTKTPKKTTKGVKPPKTLKKAKVVPKAAKSLVGVKKAKKAAAKTSVKKIKGKSKKKVQRKRTVLKKKFLREKLIDAKLMTGPLKKLEWTDWYLAVCSHIPKGYGLKKFQRSSAFGAYHRRNLFDNDSVTPAIYEIGVSRFGKFRPKKFAMYFRVSRGFSSRKSLILYLIRNKKIRQEVDRLVGNKYEIHIRRGVAKGKDKSTKLHAIKAAADYLHENFDYAWRRHGKKGHRKVARHGVMLSDPAL